MESSQVVGLFCINIFIVTVSFFLSFFLSLPRFLGWTNSGWEESCLFFFFFLSACLPACLPAVVDLKLRKGTLGCFSKISQHFTPYVAFFFWESSARSMNAAPRISLFVQIGFSRSSLLLLHVRIRLPMRRGQGPHPPDLASGEAHHPTS